MNSNKNNEAASDSEDFLGPESSRLVIEMTIARYFATPGQGTLSP